jgi:hypothetical protein
MTGTIIIAIIFLYIYGKNKLSTVNYVALIIQLNSCLFTCKLNIIEANYKVSTEYIEIHKNNEKQNTKL